MAAFQCEVCFDPCTQRLPLPMYSTLNGDVIRAADCNHPVCQDCMARFVTARVEEQLVFGIRCPSVGCKIELQEKDVQNLVRCGALPQVTSDRLSDIRKRDYAARAMDLSSEVGADLPADLGLLRRLWACARKCPRCNVIIERSEGCNSFGCICGHRFDFSSAPRGFADGIEHFESVIELATEQEMPMEEAMSQVREACAKGIRKYRVVMSYMKSRQVPVSVAETHALAFFGQQSALDQLRQARLSRQEDKKKEMLMSRLGLSPEDAQHLVDQARSGDEAAWAQIRQARQSRSERSGTELGRLVLREVLRVVAERSGSESV